VTPAERAIEDAIRAHIAAEDPDENHILTDWIVLAATFVPRNDGSANGYFRVTRDGQPIHSSLGLIAEANQTYLRNALLPDDGGDDE